MRPLHLYLFDFFGGSDCEIAHAGTCSQSVCGSGTQVFAGFGELAELAHTWFEVLWVA